MRAALTCRSCGAKQKDTSARFCNRCGKPLSS
jgi:predicted amidophosphoribosyltransferase